MRLPKLPELRGRRCGSSLAETEDPICNPVVTCRHITINSSASAPLNAKKNAVKKVSDVDVIRFGPELKLSMDKCCFWRVFVRDSAHSG